MAMQSPVVDPRPHSVNGVGGTVIRMPASNARGLALSGTALAVTGVLLALMRYVFPSDNPFSAYPATWWKPVIAIHVLATPAFFFFVGSIWWRHVVRHWKARERRLSGVVVIGLLAVVAASGYALYFVGGERTLAMARAIHAVAGVAATLVYAHHAILGWKAVAARRSAMGRTGERALPGDPL